MLQYFECGKFIRKLSEKQYYRFPIEYQDEYLLEKLKNNTILQILRSGHIPKMDSVIFKNIDLINITLSDMNMSDFIYNNCTKNFLYQMFWWIASIRGIPLLKINEETISSFTQREELLNYSPIEQYFILHTGYEPPKCKIFDKNSKYNTGEYISSTIENELHISNINFWIYTL